MSYEAVKVVHLLAVAISGTGFFVRGWASLAGARWVRGRAARTLPHVND
ncbi:MAG: SirB2 family protein, partial [Caldimonas sp.]